MSMTDDAMKLQESIRKADDLILAAMRSYLRTSRSGGMPLKLSRQIEAAVANAARLNMFSVAIAETCQTKE